MKIKHKITTALLILFLLILGLGGVGSYYINLLSVNSGEIMDDNYRTLQYIHRMTQALNALEQDLILGEQEASTDRENAILRLKENLSHQKNNITERGEQELTAELNQKTEKLISSLNENRQATAYQAIFAMEQNLKRLYHMNEDALLARNQQSQETAEKVLLYMLTISACVLIVALLVLFTFPRLIIKPIRQFSESIKEIARGNYNIQISLKQKDEFGEMASSFNKMTKKLQEYEKSSYVNLLDERNRLDAVINQLSEGIIGLNVSKKILFANKKALNLLHLREEQLIGQYAPDIAVTNELLNSLIKELMIPFEEWEERKFKPVTITEENKEKLYAKDIVDIKQKPIGEEKECLSGHVILLTDVTEFSEKEKAKTAFMSTLSHELKTPVAAIEMGTQLLRNHKLGILSEEQEAWLKTIDENNQRIKQSINQVLNLSKLERGLIELNTSAVNPELMIDQAIKAVEPFVNEKRLSIKSTIERPLPDVIIDPNKLVWILNNVLINAIRYTPELGTIQVNGTRVNTHRIRISVTDEGPGISPENQQLIFEPFKRVSGDHTEGLGLGLSISKEFIEAMNGRIGVRSGEGQGAEFWIELPAAPESNA